jgi:hypothetical protein
MENLLNKQSSKVISKFIMYHLIQSANYFLIIYSLMFIFNYFRDEQ